MQGQDAFRDRFRDYLTRRLDPNRANQIVYNSQKSNQSPNLNFLSPQYSPQQNQYNLCTSSQSSINSSQFSFSQSNSKSYKKQSSRKSNRSNYQTTSMKKNRLRKVKDIQQNICSICLEQYRDRVQMSCKHSYCHQCLKQWLKTSSRCPYCRADCPFYIRQGVKYEIQQKRYQYQPMQQVDDGLDFQCYMCQQTNEGDQVLICDRCQLYACHIRCDPRLRGILLNQNEEWYCHFCS